MARRQRTARLDEGDDDALDRWLTEHRVTFTAVVQALAESVRAGRWPTERAAVARAAKIDRRRRSRR